MEENSKKVSLLLDNELDDQRTLNVVLSDPCLQKKFSRYQLIGDTLRGDNKELDEQIDVTANVMSFIDKSAQPSQLYSAERHESSSNNITPFIKRVTQYAIAASVAGVVVLINFTLNSPSLIEPSSPQILNTVPLGGVASPVGLHIPELSTHQTEIEARNKRLDALMKDHQLQLQAQP